MLVGDSLHVQSRFHFSNFQIAAPWQHYPTDAPYQYTFEQPVEVPYCGTTPNTPGFKSRTEPTPGDLIPSGPAVYYSNMRLSENIQISRSSD